MGVAPLMVVVFVIGLHSSQQQDASVEKPNQGCTLGGKGYPNGALTPSNRCMRYQCDNGVWKYYDQHITCAKCETSSKRGENTAIKTYVPHTFGGAITPTYKFLGDGGFYSLTQKDRGPLNLGVEVKFTYTEATESRVTEVKYKESGIVVEFKTGPGKDSEIKVNGSLINPYNRMEPKKSDVGIVYISHDGPSWPQTFSGTNIHIVGSQGLTVLIYSLNGYAWFVKTYATKSLENKLFGLCDIYTIIPPGGKPPNKYTKKDGNPTTDISAFTASWKI